MTQPQVRLQVSRIIKAERKKVFEAWIKPEIMKKWFCPQDLDVAEVSADLRVGGKYRIAMKDIHKTFVTFGTYRQIVPNEKLVFTWEWEEPGQSGSVVTVDFRDKDGGTEVVVTHERFTDMEGEKTHEEGWTSALLNLAQKVFNETK